MTEKGAEFRGGSLHDGCGGFDDSGEHLVLLLLVLQIKGQRGNRHCFDAFGGFDGSGGVGR